MMQQVVRLWAVGVVILMVLGWWFGVWPAQVRAEEACTQTCTKTDDENDQQQFISCVSQKKSCLEQQIKSLQSQKVTLNTTISIFNGKIAVQELQIKQIENEIASLERQISQLSQRIDGLNVSLDRLSAVLVERVKSQYEVSRVNKISLILTANSLRDSLFQATYLEELSRLTAQAMERAEAQRITYDQQKAVKEEKQQEVEKKQQQLKVERNTLAQQRQEQQSLLKVTNNNEARYQQLLAEAQAQIDSFKKFVSVSGGGVIGPDGLGKGYDGSYFSQRDSRWASTAIGNSRENIYNVGCLITSIAMVLKSKGVDVTPSSIGSNSSFFFANTAYMLSRSSMSLPGGKSDRKIPTSEINKELENNNPVIVGVRAGPYGTHFVVLKKKDGDNWIMFDPWFGPDIAFTSRYSKGSIFSAEIIQ